mgnify:CR=1 FL=1
MGVGVNATLWPDNGGLSREAPIRNQVTVLLPRFFAGGAAGERQKAVYRRHTAEHDPDAVASHRYLSVEVLLYMGALLARFAEDASNHRRHPPHTDP